MLVNMNYFAKNISILRKSFKVTQVEISAALGLKRNTWSNYENGASEPSFDGAIKIANYFDITLTELLETDLEKSAHLVEEITGKKNNTAKNKYNTNKILVTGGMQEKLVNEDVVPYRTQQEIIESLTSAIKGLEASNAYLIIENQRLRTENELLKKKRSSSTKA